MCLVVGYTVYMQAHPKHSLSGTDFNRIDSGITNSSTSVGILSTQIFATGTVTSYGKITNLGPAVVYCSVGQAAVTQARIALNPIASSTGPNFHQFDDTNLPVQVVNCIASATSTLAIYAK